ncbi:MAG: hypothetical protein ACK5M7_19895 [Draconibacterium sp.]
MKLAYQLLTFFLLLACLAPVRSLSQNPFPQKDTTLVNDPLEEITITAFRSPYNVFNTPAPVNLILRKPLKIKNLPISLL